MSAFGDIASLSLSVSLYERNNEANADPTLLKSGLFRNLHSHAHCAKIRLCFVYEISDDVSLKT